MLCYEANHPPLDLVMCVPCLVHLIQRQTYTVADSNDPDCVFGWRHSHQSLDHNSVYRISAVIMPAIHSLTTPHSH